MVLEVVRPTTRVVETGGVKALLSADVAAWGASDAVDGAAGMSSSKGIDNTIARLMALRAMELLPVALVRALGDGTGEERGSTATTGCRDSKTMSLLPVDTRAKRDGAIGGPPMVTTVAKGGGERPVTSPPDGEMTR